MQIRTTEKRDTRILVRLTVGKLSPAPMEVFLKMRKTDNRKITSIATAIQSPVSMILFLAVIVIADLQRSIPARSKVLKICAKRSIFE